MKAAPLFDRAAHYNPARLYPVYVAGEKELLGHIAKLYGDFWRPQKFARLCAPLRHLTEKDFETGENHDCRDVIAEPIKRLLDWI